MKPLHKGLRPALHRLAKCLSDRKGSIFVVVGAALPVLIGVLGLGADAGIWYANKRAAQTQTDAAAISGAFEKARFNASNITPAAQKEAIRNGFQNAAPNTLTIHNPPTSGSHSGDVRAVEVIMSTQQPLLFAQFFLDSVSIKTRAVASVQTTGSACVLALDPTVSSALKSSGSSTVNMPGCVMASNSSSASAIAVGGSTTIAADSLWTPGNYTTQGGASSLSLTRPPVVGAWPIDDPYAGVPLPIPTGPNLTFSAPNNVPTTIPPGIYNAGIQITSQKIITLQAGTYYMNNGSDFSVAGGAVVRCECTGTNGVTIVLTNDSGTTIGNVTINAGADVQLKAPSDGAGTYSGLAFYQDPRASSTGTSKFNGGSTMSIQGAIYFPKRAIQFNGNDGPSGSSCTQIIGRTVEFNGNATVNNTGCQAAGIEPITISGVRVVE